MCVFSIVIVIVSILWSMLSLRVVILSISDCNESILLTYSLTSGTEESLSGQHQRMTPTAIINRIRQYFLITSDILCSAYAASQGTA